ncbi:HAD family hydrolase [Tundrisphaera lichenicola]|uniref:HAD family hydrolase n=1 Tax=Tundrisphaera lichenicola TaxID=2029860 RepID=UPI003EC03F3C
MPTELPLLAIFDHDGVLVDSLDLHQRAWVEMGRRGGLPITAEFVRETFGMTNPAMFRRLLGDSLPEDELDRHSETKESIYRDLARGQITLMAGVRDLLGRLKASRYRLAVGTSGIRPNIDLTIETCGLEGVFDAIASAYDITRSKPDPEVFLVAARKAGIPPEQSVVFEDAVVGIQAAKAAGMKAVGVTTHHPAASLFEGGADLVVDHLDGFDVEGLTRLILDGK